MAPRLPTMLTVKQVAVLLSTSEKTVRRRIDGGDLHAHFVGRQIRISVEDYQTYVATSRR